MMWTEADVRDLLMIISAGKFNGDQVERIAELKRKILTLAPKAAPREKKKE